MILDYFFLLLMAYGIFCMAPLTIQIIGDILSEDPTLITEESYISFFRGMKIVFSCLVYFTIQAIIVHLF
jgi:hypothetical protein